VSWLQARTDTTSAARHSRWPALGAQNEDKALLMCHTKTTCKRRRWWRPDQTLVEVQQHAHAHLHTSLCHMMSTALVWRVHQKEFEPHWASTHACNRQTDRQTDTPSQQVSHTSQHPRGHEERANNSPIELQNTYQRRAVPTGCGCLSMLMTASFHLDSRTDTPLHNPSVFLCVDTH
jgi:hypothetical protein